LWIKVEKFMLRAFHNRRDAGRQLAQKLRRFAACKDGLVLALPRGGVPVAFEIAQALHLPLDVLIVRKLGVPGQEELAMGAIASGGVRVLLSDVIVDAGIDTPIIERVTAEQTRELMRRELAYRGHRPYPLLENKTVILVDDGIATGATVRAAVQSLRMHAPKAIVLAVPVGAAESLEALAGDVDEITCLLTPRSLYGIGEWYEDFGQLNDEDVRALLSLASEREETNHG
jgi:putative phosphoribosyl transferase